MAFLPFEITKNYTYECNQFRYCTILFVRFITFENNRDVFSLDNNNKFKLYLKIINRRVRKFHRFTSTASEKL